MSSAVASSNISFCSLVTSEDAYIAEWITYHRLLHVPSPPNSRLGRLTPSQYRGVQQFYLYDTDPTESLAQTLLPFIDDGSVTLHQMRFTGMILSLPCCVTACSGVRAGDNALNYHTLHNQHCISHYGNVSTWLIDIDVDEFLVYTPSVYQEPWPRRDATKRQWLFPLHDYLLTPPFLYARCITLSRLGPQV